MLAEQLIRFLLLPICGAVLQCTTDTDDTEADALYFLGTRDYMIHTLATLSRELGDVTVIMILGDPTSK